MKTNKVRLAIDQSRLEPAIAEVGLYYSKMLILQANPGKTIGKLISAMLQTPIP
ncbi:MAG: hypothetical protein U0Z17_06480 [Bacteroidales bacterium]